MPETCCGPRTNCEWGADQLQRSERWRPTDEGARQDCCEKRDALVDCIFKAVEDHLLRRGVVLLPVDNAGMQQRCQRCNFDLSRFHVLVDLQEWDDGLGENLCVTLVEVILDVVELHGGLISPYHLEQVSMFHKPGTGQHQHAPRRFSNMFKNLNVVKLRTYSPNMA